eukprot:6714337-Ditylum_brightwellii.AAC.1
MGRRRKNDDKNKKAKEEEQAKEALLQILNELYNITTRHHVQTKEKEEWNFVQALEEMVTTLDSVNLTSPPPPPNHMQRKTL